ncbi:hypothetical protein JIY74_29180 [Vibrio harveyi]|nr:hypothetical protein [Vibrio harveyi]
MCNCHAKVDKNIKDPTSVITEKTLDKNHFGLIVDSVCSLGKLVKSQGVKNPPMFKLNEASIYLFAKSSSSVEFFKNLTITKAVAIVLHKEYVTIANNIGIPNLFSGLTVL